MSPSSSITLFRLGNLLHQQIDVNPANRERARQYYALYLEHNGTAIGQIHQLLRELGEWARRAVGSGRQRRK